MEIPGRMILSCSFFDLDELHAAYIFTSKRYRGPIALYKSHRVANYGYSLIFLEPHLDVWGNDRKISRIVYHRDLDLRIGDEDRVPVSGLIEQAEKLPFPTAEEVNEAKEYLKVLRQRKRKWWEVWKYSSKKRPSQFKL